MQELTASDTRVTACIPYYRGKRYIRRAVESLLAQTHRDLTIVVVNDGDPEPPWYQLAHIRDPRLVRFSLRRNHGGPFFANAVVLNASRSPYFLIQEQDDWSEPYRVSKLLTILKADHADFAISAQNFYEEADNGRLLFLGARWFSTAANGVCLEGNREQMIVDHHLTKQYQHRAPHSGLFHAPALRRIGGYFAGLNLHYDSLLMNFLMMTGRMAHTRVVLYNRLLRKGSLTRSQHSGFRSEASKKEIRLIRTLYSRAFTAYECYLNGRLSSGSVVQSIRDLMLPLVSDRTRQELVAESTRLVRL
jgi:glycosyltransferase involved in cell wall biosynthesis